MKKMHFSYFAIGGLILALCLSSCDTGTDTKTGSGNNSLIGFWRSENTYKDTSPSGTYNMYDIYIFKKNKVMNFSTTSLEHIKSENYDVGFYAKWWDSYTIDGDKIIIDSGENDGYQYKNNALLFFGWQSFFNSPSIRG
jgi:hypothetical protein